VEVIEAKSNLGYAGGVNLCLQTSQDADAWWVLNPDTEPHPKALAALVAHMAEGQWDAVGSLLLLGDDKVQSYGGIWRAWLARAVSLGYGDNLAQVPSAEDIESRQNYLSGASMLVNRSFVQTAGLMREDYFLYCEEVEWCLRAKRLGARLGVATGARVLHKQGTSTGSGVDFKDRSRLSVYLNERNRLLLTRDCFPARLPLAALAALLLIFARYGRRGAWRQLGYALEGWRAGMVDQRGFVNPL